jgi:hypothetical protein
MNNSYIAPDSEKHLIDSINKLSSQLYFRVEKNQSIHSSFLQEIIEDMEEQLNMIRRARELTE